MSLKITLFLFESNYNLMKVHSTIQKTTSEKRINQIRIVYKSIFKRKTRNLNLEYSENNSRESIAPAT